MSNNSTLSVTSGRNLLTMDVNDFITIKDISYCLRDANYPEYSTCEQILLYYRYILTPSCPGSACFISLLVDGDGTNTGATSQLFPSIQSH